MKALIVTVLFLIGCKSTNPHKNYHIHELRKGLLSSDNLVILDQIRGLSYQASTKRLGQLAPLFEIKGMSEGHDCLCYADYVLIFYKNGQYNFALGLHPGMGLRWTNSPWLSDGRLNEFSFFLVLDWIHTELDQGTLLDNYELPQKLSEEQ